VERPTDRGGPPIAAPIVSSIVGTPAVRLADVSAGYDDQVVLSGIDLDIEPGTLTSVVGPNGAGKSTLLKVIAGLLPARRGEVRVLGEGPGGAAHRIAYVPQAELVDWQFPVSVADVVAMGRYPRLAPFRRLDREDRRQVAAALELVGMADFADRQIGRLSGGQRRRVFIARALAAEPELFLLDEPVTGIDVTTQEEILDILEAQARAGRTILATTHDLLCAAERFQRVVAINRTVIAHGPSSLILDRDLLRQTYGGHLLILDGQTVALDDAHHHDQSPGAEAHYHEGSQR
jgi:ABC-type Mn2+/Zn2+ transport system ATPase subunit